MSTALDRLPAGWHSPSRVAEFLGLSTRTIRRRIADGSFGSPLRTRARSFSGTDVRVSARGVNEWLDAQLVEVNHE